MNKLHKGIIWGLILVAPFWFGVWLAFSATYYVIDLPATGCADNNVASATVDGTDYNPTDEDCDGGGSSSYFSTIADINAAAATLEPGDTISFNKGGIWREQLTVPESGTEGNPYTFTSHGTGDDPIISGADTPSWTEEALSGNANLNTNTEALGSWSKTRATTGDNVASPLAPDGTQTVEGLISSVDDNTHNINQEVAVSPETQYTFSVYVYPGDKTWIELVMMDFDVGWGYVDSGGSWFDIENGALGATQFGLDARNISDVGGGWYRCSISYTTNASQVHSLVQIFSAEGNSDSSFQGDATTVDTYAWGAKTEQSATTTVYQAFTGYYSSHSVDPNQVLEDTSRLVESEDQGLFPGQFWFDNGNNRVYVRTSGDDNPSGYTFEISQRDYCFYGNGKSYINIDGIALRNADEENLKNQAGSNWIINDLDTQYAWGAGIFLWGTAAETGVDDCIIQNSTAMYNGSTGFYAGNYGLNGQILNNTASYNCIADSYDTNAGIKIWSGPTPDPVRDNLSGWTVAYNQSDHNGDGTTFRGAGIWLDFTNSNIVKFNRVFDNYLVGIWAEKCSGTQIFNNVVYNHTSSHISNSGRGIQVGMSDRDEYTVEDNLVYNNTVYNSRQGLVLFGRSGGVGVLQNNEFINNICLLNSIDDIYRDENGVGSGNIWQYNSFGVEPIDINWDGSAYTTYDAWETAYGGTTNSVETDPLFTNAAGGDFTLQAGSPACRGGTYLSGYTTKWKWGQTDPLTLITIEDALSIGAYACPKGTVLGQ